MALIKINDREMEVAVGETILRAAVGNGVYIPHYCYHPALSIVGNCRMCLVEVQGAPKLLTACSTTIPNLPPEKKIDGKYDMVVSTTSEQVRKARKSVLEFFLLNHPLDCPICDQAGECMLQKYSYDYGAPESRQTFEKLHAPKRVDIGPHVVYDAERCIKCTRCVRFCEEIAKTGELTMVERGAHTLVETFPGRALDNFYSGCVVDVCPVGALTSKEFRFRERVWFLNSVNSVCPECSRGCSVRMDAFKGEVLRIVPRRNREVNGPWMCDYGRLLSERLKKPELTARPRVRGKQGWTARKWDSFAPLLAKETEALVGDDEKPAVVLSGRMTLEEMVAFRMLSRELLGGAAGTVLNVSSGEDDDLLIRKERRPNLKGASLTGLHPGEENAPVSTLFGGKRTALVVREDVVGDAVGAEKKRLKKLISDMEFVVVADYRFTETAALAQLFIPLCGWHEMEGLTVNFKGVVQKTFAAVAPPGQRKTFWEVVSLWLKAAGIEAPEASFAAWYGEVKAAIPALAGLSIRDLLPNGVLIEEVAE